MRIKNLTAISVIYEIVSTCYSRLNESIIYLVFIFASKCCIYSCESMARWGLKHNSHFSKYFNFDCYTSKEPLYKHSRISPTWPSYGIVTRWAMGRTNLRNKMNIPRSGRYINILVNLIGYNPKQTFDILTLETSSHPKHMFSMSSSQKSVLILNQSTISVQKLY